MPFLSVTTTWLSSSLPSASRLTSRKGTSAMACLVESSFFWNRMSARAIWLTKVRLPRLTVWPSVRILNSIAWEVPR